MDVKGSGSQLVMCDCNYRGGTTIESGATLDLGYAGTEGSLQGTINILSGGVLQFYEPANETYGNTITGAGEILDANAVIILSGDHSGFTGTKVGNIAW